MAGGIRRGSRIISLNRNSDFVYEEDNWRPLLNRNTRELTREDTNRQQGSSSSNPESLNPESRYQITYSEDSEDSVFSQTRSGWSDLENLPLYCNTIVNSATLHQSAHAVSEVSGRSVSLRQQLQQNTQVSIVSESYVNTGARPRSRNSSTRYNFLDLDYNNFRDLEYNFFSAASSSAISEMSESDEASSNKCTVCKVGEPTNCVVCKSNETNQLAKAMLAGLKKIEVLTTKVNSLESIIINSGISGNPGGSGSSKMGESSKSSHSSKQKDKKGGKSSKKKKDRAQEDRERTLHLLLEKMTNRNKNGVQTESEDDEEVVCDESSDEESDTKALGKKMPKKMKEDCNAKLEALLRKAGHTFPVEDVSGYASSSSSSGTDTSHASDKKVKRKYKKSIKSGAKIKKRPVVKTELWPHTICNEEEGEEVNSEDITLATFLSCFTFIMTNCESTEATGRSMLLHAVASVLKYQPWAEARSTCLSQSGYD